MSGGTYMYFLKLSKNIPDRTQPCHSSPHVGLLALRRRKRRQRSPGANRTAIRQRYHVDRICILVFVVTKAAVKNPGVNWAAFSQLAACLTLHNRSLFGP